MVFPEYIKGCQLRVDERLKRVLPDTSLTCPDLVNAMSYSVFGGGKRIRPVLVYATGHAMGAEPDLADPAACSVECVHAYSLVHDDLPAMDDDDLRRGQPTCHKAFDEATAILAGDALQTLAFELLTDRSYFPDITQSDDTRLQLVQQLAHASGHKGMCGGQSMDLNAVGSQLTQGQLALMHRHKTGALIRASVLMGAVSSGKVSSEQISMLTHYADAVGLAFQVQDDILDVTAETEILGKRQGADDALGKPTYVSLMGLPKAEAFAELLCQRAIDYLRDFDEKAYYLRALAEYIIHRSH